MKMQDMETTPIDLEGFPRRALSYRSGQRSGGRVRCFPPRRLLARCTSVSELMGRARYEALRDEALRTRFWAESTTPTAVGRIRFRLQAFASEAEGLVDLDLQHSPHVDSDLEALLGMVADSRWEWDLRNGSAEHTGTGVMRSASPRDCRRICGHCSTWCTRTTGLGWTVPPGTTWRAGARAIARNTASATTSTVAGAGC
ncbi:MAG: hypothetical protein U5R48_15180 [Gammaproteobacteria bacterium]|nr:hypothetical protein [Gammaproteobacteria bacterium]